MRPFLVALLAGSLSMLLGCESHSTRTERESSVVVSSAEAKVAVEPESNPSLQSEPLKLLIPQEPSIPSQWGISGRIGVIKEEEGWHGNVDWQQSPSGFRARFYDPFGSEQAQLIGGNGPLRVQMPDGRIVTGDRLRKWERKSFGYPLPLEAIPYWMHGLPTPNAAIAGVRRDGKQLLEMQQLGWKIRYGRWKQRGEQRLPGRIILTKAGVEVKLVIDGYRRG